LTRRTAISTRSALDAKHCEIYRLRDNRRRAVRLEHNLDAGPLGKPGSERTQRCGQPVVVEYVGAQLGHHVAHGIHRSLDELTRVLETRHKVGVSIWWQAVRDNAQVESQCGEILPDAVVQFSREEPALGLLDFDEAMGRGSEVLRHLGGELQSPTAR
jgi:hypothetical protein